MDLKDRNALVTGAGVRVGRAIALHLAAQGVAVFIHYNSSAGPAEELRSEIVEAGGRAAIGSGDLSDPSSVSQVIESATEALGPVSILVNSASGFRADTIENVTVDGWRDTHDLTLGSALFLTQAFAEAMPASMQGAVVNITDAKTMRPYREHLSYVLAKGGLDTLTRAAALSLAPRIRVNAVALGVILAPAGETQEYVDTLTAQLPLQRTGGADVVAEAVEFLAANDFITGEIIRIDGGAHLV